MFSSILLPIDIGAAGVARQLDYAVATARQWDATLHLLTVVPDYGMSIVGSFFPAGHEEAAQEKARAELAPYVERARAEGARSEGHVGHGSIYDQILKFAEHLDCDLIVIGAHRPELKDYLLGPNAARVVRHARQSVVVIRER